MPAQHRERAERDRLRIRDRRAPALQVARLMLSQFIGVTIFALIGRWVFRLKLGRSGDRQS
jgi:hypothetical protein